MYGSGYPTPTLLIYFFPSIFNTFLFNLPSTLSIFFFLLNQLLFFLPLKCLNPCPRLRTLPLGVTLNRLAADFLVFCLFFVIFLFRVGIPDPYYFFFATTALNILPSSFGSLEILTSPRPTINLLTKAKAISFLAFSLPRSNKLILT